MIVSYALDVFWSIRYIRIVRTIIVDWVITFDALISVC
jgi:hypothetical protein